MNNHGKTLTIVSIMAVVVLSSSTAIGFFLYNKEIQARAIVQKQLDESQRGEMKLQGELREIKRQLALAQDRAKEADDKINNAMDEIELKEGLRKQLKEENTALKEALEEAKKDKEQALQDLESAQKKFKIASDLLKSEQDKSSEYQVKVAQLQIAKDKVEKDMMSLRAGLASDNILPAKTGPSKIELDKIVVNPQDGTRGKVLSVDKDNDFLVSNLGVKHGVRISDLLSVYRGEEYLGDVRVTRVQEELCAADMIPPFSSRKVRKNDVVVFRP